LPLQPMVKEVIDLSVPMKSLDTPVYPGYPQPLRSSFTTVRDNGYASFVWTFAEHSSTHVDSPAHFVEGAMSIDRVPISRYVSQGLVLDFTGRPPRYSITRKDIETGMAKAGKKVGPGWALLFYTGYSNKSKTPEWMDHPELSEEASRYIVELGVNAIGFDAPGPDHEPFSAHKILLPKTIGIYENLANLDKLLDREFLFVGAPLKLVGGSASPTRALAVIF
jgi:arylformamidase